MVTYPIQIRRDTYRGADARKRQKASELNAMATKLEQAINKMLFDQTAPISQYMWHPISRETGIPYDVVAKLGMGIDGGSNGFTALRRGLTYAQAMALRENPGTASVEPS